MLLFQFLSYKQLSHQAGLVVYRICGLIVSLNILTNHVLKISMS